MYCIPRQVAMPAVSRIAKEKARRRRARPENRVKENAKRDYNKEYKRDQSSRRRLRYRGSLQKLARKRGIYKKTPKGMELGHQSDGSIRLEDKRQNRRKGARNAARARERNRATLSRARRRRR